MNKFTSYILRKFKADKCCDANDTPINDIITANLATLQQDITAAVQPINKMQEDIVTIAQQVEKNTRQLEALQWQIDAFNFAFSTHIMTQFARQKLTTNQSRDVIDINKYIKHDANKVAGTLSEHDLEYLHSNLEVIFRGAKIVSIHNAPEQCYAADAFYIWGVSPNIYASTIIELAISADKPLLYIEDGFLRSICPVVMQHDVEKKYVTGVSFTIDDLTSYYDTTQPSRLELLLNNSSLQLTTEDRQRARKLINQIVTHKLSKYNHQSDKQCNVGVPGRKKVLVVDQSYGDYSIIKGMADADTFKNMLLAAMSENPTADILIKTHPDTLAMHKESKYFDAILANNVYLIDAAINPITILEVVDHVYVVTSQLGFEALMCGKLVSVFGLPFYACWGVTDDRQVCARRVVKRDIEEIFYITYIMYSKYVNPIAHCICEIEDAIEYLLTLRHEFNQCVEK